LENKLLYLEPLTDLVTKMNASEHKDIASYLCMNFLLFYLVSATRNNSVDIEHMLSNRINNLVETLAYKHEIRVVENQMNNLNIKFDSNDYLIKENDKKYYELQSEMK
jgi:hypothetical protein